ncbi:MULTISPECIES: DUF3888 domain-containing protein [Priestia]|uniref:DUF3888 domain-containing protein n=1 Tax=Priestia aryabhattai TaxID=412384 RepID=A0A7W3NFS0_PRIAR|nr:MULTISPECIES: DUF3888 domain-containing protein [Priestia]MBZ5482464.1 DUF3888 domain-containing protein [Bacillus sp. T_4]MCJ7983090.1 DUF3888 domain-containing protein [Priestia sp. OVL9]MBA9042117.1 hypothetical protein [Priestia aryabhattai]MBW0932940.1 DUF3888 domain-containing protein [Priestia megaterium]MCG0049770.1 DUF3888 domain-containing protein [Priestia aryabhattai]
MKRFIVATALVLCLTGRMATCTEAAPKPSITQKHTDFYDAFLMLLNPYAEKAIRTKYPDRSYSLWNANILSLKRVSGGFSNYDFVVKVKYHTFTGPHNPPEGPLVITFSVSNEVKILKVEDNG